VFAARPASLGGARVRGGERGRPFFERRLQLRTRLALLEQVGDLGHPGILVDLVGVVGAGAGLALALGLALGLAFRGRRGGVVWGRGFGAVLLFSRFGSAFFTKGVRLRGPAPVWILFAVLGLGLAGLVLPVAALLSGEVLPAESWGQMSGGTLGRRREIPMIFERVEWLPSTLPGTCSLRMKEERKRMKALGGRGMCVFWACSSWPRRVGIDEHKAPAFPLSSIRASLPTLASIVLYRGKPTSSLLSSRWKTAIEALVAFLSELSMRFRHSPVV
jgi:hypothetical protein